MNIFRKYIWLLIVFSSISVKAQVNSIDLPKSDNDIKVNKFTPFFSIYIDKNNNVYLEKERINAYDVAKTLSFIRYKLPEHLKFRVKIHLYVDKHANYKTIDIIKTQLASAYFYQLYYKTNSIEDKDVFKGLPWINHHSFFKLENIKKTLTDKEVEKNRRFNDSLRKLGDDFVIPPPPPMPTSWLFANQHKIYSDNQEAIEEALKYKTYKCVLLTNQGLKVGSKIIGLKDYDNLKKLFNSIDVVFISFAADLSYSNYFQTISSYQEMDYKERAFFVELSSEIVGIYKKSNITLCD